MSHATMQLADIANELLALGREERALIDEGRLEDLVDVAGRRGHLVAALDDCYAEPVSPEVRETLRLVKLEGQENLSRLRIAQDEIRHELSDNRATGRAVAGYGNASRY